MCRARFILFLYIIFSLGVLHTAEKTISKKVLNTEPASAQTIIINTGSLIHPITNSVTSRITGRSKGTFIIGIQHDEDNFYPSMQWRIGGYDNNNYLYDGHFFVGYNNDVIRFNTATSNDFTVIENDPENPFRYGARFSMTDDSAGTLYVGIKTICTVMAWPEPYRSNYFIYEYDIINTSGILLEDVYTCARFDYDVSSAGGGKGTTAFYRDDMVNYYLGTDANSNPESISYMYDDECPDIPGDDTGGRYSPKESLGYIGSRVLNCPESKKSVPENQQSGHYWHDWGADPTISCFYTIMQKEEFRISPGSPHDYRCIQTMGPWDLAAEDTLTIAFALGIGEGLDGMRENLQTAYDEYWSGFDGPSIPYIIGFNPVDDSVDVYMGNRCQFEISAVDLEVENLIYTWQIDDLYSRYRDSCYVFDTEKYDCGWHTVAVEVSNNRFRNVHLWQVNLLPSKKFALYQNYPNPFNSSTRIPFEIKSTGPVQLKIYDINGRLVWEKNEMFDFGQNEFVWNGRSINGQSISSGIYFYQLKAENTIATKRMLILK